MNRKTKYIFIVIVSILLTMLSPISGSEVQAAKYKTGKDSNGKTVKYMPYNEPDCQGYLGKRIGKIEGTQYDDLGIWSLNKTRKNVSINIAEVSPDDLVKKIHSLGQEGIENKISYILKFKYKDMKALKEYAHKVKNSLENTYGLSFDITSGALSANEAVYLEMMCDRALEKLIEPFSEEPFNQIFKDKEQIRNFDDSNKIYFLSKCVIANGGFDYDNIYLKNKGTIYGKYAWSRYYSMELIYKGKARGVCSDSVAAWQYVVRMVVEPQNYKFCEINPPNHVAGFYVVKNAYGEYDCFGSNNGSFETYNLGYPKSYFSNKKLYGYLNKKSRQLVVEKMIDDYWDELEKDELCFEDGIDRQKELKMHRDGLKFNCKMVPLEDGKVKYIVSNYTKRSDITHYAFYSVPPTDTTDYKSSSELAKNYKAYFAKNTGYYNYNSFSFSTRQEWKKTIYFAFTYAGQDEGLIRIDQDSSYTGEELTYTVIY